MIVCRKCGQQNEDGDSFCGSCGSFLEWTGERSDPPPEPVARTPLPGAAAHRPQAPRPSVSSPIVLILRESGGTVEPGGLLTLTLELRNKGREVDQVTVQVLGDAARWAEVEPSVINLMPDSAATAMLRFRPPRASSTRAGAVEYGVSVSSRVHPEAAVVERGVVKVGPFVGFSARLAPQIARGRRSATFKITCVNSGNTPTEAELTAQDPEDALVFDFAPRDRQVEPGASRVASLQVRAPGTVWLGRGRSWPFHVGVSADRTPAQGFEGTFVQVPVVPGWLPRAVGAIAVVAIGLGALFTLQPWLPSASAPSAGPPSQGVSNTTPAPSVVAPTGPTPAPTPVPGPPFPEPTGVTILGQVTYTFGAAADGTALTGSAFMPSNEYRQVQFFPVADQADCAKVLLTILATPDTGLPYNVLSATKGLELHSCNDRPIKVQFDFEATGLEVGVPTAVGKYRVLFYDQSGQTQVYDWSGSAAPLADASGTIGFKITPPKPFYIAFISGPAGSPLYVTGVRAFYNAVHILPIKP